MGFLTSTRALKSCQSIVSHCERITEISLLGNPTTTVLCCYYPHNEQQQEEVAAFYQELSTKINTIPAHNLVMIGGDFNAQLGPLDALFTTTKATNRNGSLMMDFMQHHHLIASNTRFQNRINRLWTHRRHRRSTSTIRLHLSQKEMDQLNQELMCIQLIRGY